MIIKNPFLYPITILTGYAVTVIKLRDMPLEGY
jgi:hypothetical protein